MQLKAATVKLSLSEVIIVAPKVLEYPPIKFVGLKNKKFPKEVEHEISGTRPPQNVLFTEALSNFATEAIANVLPATTKINFSG